MQTSPTNEEKKAAVGKNTVIVNITQAADTNIVKREEFKIITDDHSKAVDTSKEGFKKASIIAPKYKITEEFGNSPLPKPPEKESSDPLLDYNLSNPPKKDSKEVAIIEDLQNRTEEIKEIKKSELSKFARQAEPSKHENESGCGLSPELQKNREDVSSVSEINYIRRKNEKRQSLGMLPRKPLKKKDNDRLSDNDLHYLLELERMKQKNMTKFMMGFCNNCMEMVKNSITSKEAEFTSMLGFMKECLESKK